MTPTPPKNPAAVALGRKGGSVKSARKAAASARNIMEYHRKMQELKRREGRKD